MKAIRTDIIIAFEFRGKDSGDKMVDFLRQGVAIATVRSKNQLDFPESLTQNGGRL